MKDNGGPSFPLVFHMRTTAGVEYENYEQGMSLRDYFQSEQTAAITIGLLRRYDMDRYNDMDMIMEAVRLGKVAADEMLREREK